MHQRRVSRGLPVVTFLSLFLASAVFALNGRDFAGYYAISNVAEQENTVQLTLTVQLFNHSDADIKNAVVSLRPNGPPMGVQGTYPAVKLFRLHKDVRLSQTFTIPQHQYEMWKQGLQPMLVVTYKDGAGVTWSKTVQLSRRPVLPTS